MLMYVVTAVCRCEGGWMSILFLFLFYLYSILFYSISLFYVWGRLIYYPSFPWRWHLPGNCRTSVRYAPRRLLKTTHQDGSKRGMQLCFQPVSFLNLRPHFHKQGSASHFFSAFNPSQHRRTSAVVGCFSSHLFFAPRVSGVGLDVIYVSTIWLLFALENAFVSGTR